MDIIDKVLLENDEFIDSLIAKIAKEHQQEEIPESFYTEGDTVIVAKDRILFRGSRSDVLEEWLATIEAEPTLDIEVRALEPARNTLGYMVGDLVIK